MQPARLLSTKSRKAHAAERWSRGFGSHAIRLGGASIYAGSSRIPGRANCLEHGRSDDAVHWRYREHIEAAEPVVGMNDRGHGDKYPPAFFLGGFVHGQDDIEVFVLVLKKRFIGGICDEREDADPLAGSVRGCRLGLIELGKRAETLQAER